MLGRRTHHFLLGVFLIAAMLAMAVGPAAADVRGDALTNVPDGFGCETSPTVSTVDFDTYVPSASGSTSCTWYQLGTFGVDPAKDTPRGYVPGDGTITSVSVRS